MYNVKYYRRSNLDEVRILAEQLYSTYEYPRQEFTFNEYIKIVLHSIEGDSMFTCYSPSGVVLGGISTSHIMYDPHIRGLGVHITNFVVPENPMYKGVAKFLLRHFRSTLEGLDWYSTTHRRGPRTLTTRYWRLHG